MFSDCREYKLQVYNLTILTKGERLKSQNCGTSTTSTTLDFE